MYCPNKIEPPNSLFSLLWATVNHPDVTGRYYPLLGDEPDNVQHNFEYWQPEINESSGDLCGLLRRIISCPIMTMVLNFHKRITSRLRKMKLIIHSVMTFVISHLWAWYHCARVTRGREMECGCDMWEWWWANDVCVFPDTELLDTWLIWFKIGLQSVHFAPV